MRNPYGFEFYPGRRLPVVCRDGVTRSAVCTGYASEGLPAAVQIHAGGKRRTVAGFLSHDLDGKVCFHAYLYRANHVFIPWTAHKPRLAAVARRLIKATVYGRGFKDIKDGLNPVYSQSLAIVCRLYSKGVPSENFGFLVNMILKRLPDELLPRLAVYFDRLARLQLTPPPPPPIE